MKVQPYVYFDGRCEEALAFYRDAVGAEVNHLMRFRDMPPAPAGGADAGCAGEVQPDKVMHAEVRIGQSTVLVSDGRALGHPKFDGFSLAVTVDTDAQAERMFAALSVGGTVQMPMTQTFFATRFGMVADQFGVIWTIVTGK